MKLQEYRKLRGLSRAAFGELIGITGIQVWRIETGRCWPRPATQRAIIKETGGAVTAADHSEAFEADKRARAAKQEGGAGK